MEPEWAVCPVWSPNLVAGEKVKRMKSGFWLGQPNQMQQSWILFLSVLRYLFDLW